MNAKKKKKEKIVLCVTLEKFSANIVIILFKSFFRLCHRQVVTYIVSY